MFRNKVFLGCCIQLSPISFDLQDHLKLISDDCLGITYKDIEYLQIGKHKVNRGMQYQVVFTAFLFLARRVWFIVY